MKIVSKAIRLAVAGSMVAGMMAIGTGSADAAVTSVATCSGMKGLGSIKSAVVGEGLTDSDNKSPAVSVKGVANPSTGTNFGSCAFASGLGTPDSGKPVVAGYSGTKQIAKWGVKLGSPESDCDTTDTGDTTEWPLNGKLSITFTDLNNTAKQNKLDGYVIVDGFTDPDNDPQTPSDVVTGHGVVVKGVAVGADIATEVYFDPILKDKLQTTETPYPGYNFDLVGALGCTTATQGDANIAAMMIGDGTSLLLGLPAAGFSLSIGN